MSQERQDLVERVFEAVSARDWDTLKALLPSDFEFNSVFAAMEGGETIHGGRGVADHFEGRLHATWEDIRLSTESVRDCGDRSVVIFNASGIAAGSRVPLDQRFGWVWSWQSGTPIRVDSYTDVAQALKAVGLAE